MKLSIKEVVRMEPLGDAAVTLILGSGIDESTHRRVQAVVSTLRASPVEGMIECVPAYCSVTVFYDPWTAYQASKLQTAEEGREGLPYDFICGRLNALLDRLTDLDEPINGRWVDIPVCYGGEYGPDLPAVAELHGLTEEEVIRLHSHGAYLVHMIGFAPGFAYLGGLPEALHTPRKTVPRLSIPPGSVGIAGDQTGIYPLDTPGGWQIIGRTPLTMFRPNQDPPSTLQAGDRIRFIPISPERFASWKEVSS